MKSILFIGLVLLLFVSCRHSTDQQYNKPVDWGSRQTQKSNFDGMQRGKYYLPVYSHIYHVHEQTTFDLAITISIRNVSDADTVYIFSADYFNTNGEKIREYIEHPIFVKPMETIEIVISEKDKAGGSGANFVFDWAASSDKNPPFIEAVMISTLDQQGISFTTHAVPIAK